MTRSRRFDIDALLEVPNDFLEVPEDFLGLSDEPSDVVPIGRAERREGD